VPQNILNGHNIYQQFPFQGPAKYSNQIGIFGMHLYHLTFLVTKPELFQCTRICSWYTHGITEAVTKVLARDLNSWHFSPIRRTPSLLRSSTSSSSSWIPNSTARVGFVAAVKPILNHCWLSSSVDSSWRSLKTSNLRLTIYLDHGLASSLSK
jgi:hypothetical protein